MARARMISKSLSTSAKRQQLHEALGPLAEFAQALYPLLVVHADDWGREPGDLFTVKAQIDPGSPRPLADFDRALRGMHEVGLIARYSVGRRHLIAIVDFEEHQTGLHKRTPSKFPPPPDVPDPEPLRARDGNAPEIPGNSRLARARGTELNRTERKDKDRAPRRTRDPHPRTPADNVKAIARLIAEEILPQHLPDAEIPEAVKVRCAQLHIAYDATAVRKAIDAARHWRARA